MSIVLLRVDERLIHGQVTVGWGARLSPGRYLVVDDVLATSEWERDLMALGVPSDAVSEFVTVAEARERLDEWDEGPERVVLLTRTVHAMLRLARKGRLAGREVNLGGLHPAEGRTQVLPYLFLGPKERRQIRELEAEGVRVTAQDLPGAVRRRARELMA